MPKPPYRAARKLPRFRSLPEVPEGLGLDLDAILKAPAEPRREHDYYPTTEPETVRALLARDGARIAQCNGIWEPAAGEGHMVRVLQPWAEAQDMHVTGTDLVDRGAGFSAISYYDFKASVAQAIITNPPYNEINARDGHGRWLRHTLGMPGWNYCAMLLSWEWPAAVSNGLGEMLDSHPFSYCYLCRWKVDFTGEGNPKHRTAWFVWDRLRQPGPSEFRFLDRVDDRQEPLL